MKNSTLSLAGVVAGAVVIVGLSAASFFIQRTIETRTIEVTGKERLMSVSSSEGNTKTEFKNFVYAKSDSYRVKDSFWNWHFRAGTVYAQIPEDGGSCVVTLSGVRWGFLSMYQNIIAAECAK